MSRVGKQIIQLPSGVSASVRDGSVEVKGPKGELTRVIPDRIRVLLDGSALRVEVDNPEEKAERSLWGTYAAHIKNMVVGVTQGFEKKLEVNGVGYRVSVQGTDVKLEVGFSHPVIFPMPSGVSASAEKNVLTLKSADIEMLGDTAAKIRAIRKPEPYKGKGIKYADETIRRKAGKAAGKGAK